MNCLHNFIRHYFHPKCNPPVEATLLVQIDEIDEIQGRHFQRERDGKWGVNGCTNLSERTEELVWDAPQWDLTAVSVSLWPTLSVRQWRHVWARATVLFQDEKSRPSLVPRLSSRYELNDSLRHESFTDISARIWTQPGWAGVSVVFSPTKSFGCRGTDVEVCALDWQIWSSQEINQTETFWEKHWLVGKYFPECVSRNWRVLLGVFSFVPFYNLNLESSNRCQKDFKVFFPWLLTSELLLGWSSTVKLNKKTFASVFANDHE